MTTRTGARVYKRSPRPLVPGACPQCGRVVAITSRGRRRSHLDKDSRPCPGGRVFVAEFVPVVVLDEEPVIMVDPPTRLGAPRSRPRAGGPPDPRICVCGWRPKRKANGQFAAHRIRPDDPCAPYCENGATRSY